MKAYEITLRIIDLDEKGIAEIKDILEHSKIFPEIAHIREADIGEWHDDHPLNKHATADAEWARLFPREDKS